MRNRVLMVFLWCMLGLIRSSAAAPAPRTEVHLLLAQTSAKPGDTVQAALQLKMQPGWHTYWRNPGDAGITTSVEWQLPAGITNTPFLWPIPEKLVVAKLMAYVYENEILLPFTFKIAPDTKTGSVELKGLADWLECSDTTCIPQTGKLAASLIIGGKSEPSPNAAAIAEWLARIPKPDPSLVASAQWDGPAQGKNRTLLIDWTPRIDPAQPDFFSYESEDYLVLGKTESLQSDKSKVRLKKTVQLSGKTWPSAVPGLLLDKTGKDPVAYETTLKINDTGAAPAAQVSGLTSPAPITLGDNSAPKSIWVLLGLAFLGGLILNIMPCVLPVIALKILGFVNQSREEPRRVRQLGIIYGLGVLASFLVLAGVVIGIKQSGSDASWGMQMQNPIFVVVMTVVVALVALNLFGVFEISLPGSTLGAATQLASREGRAGAFYNGVLATILAIPCTAPALAVAVASAIAQDSKIIILTFTFIALGLAFPYVLLSWNPKWMKLLPKPGAWMERFKIAMGFPMLATAVWLLYVNSYLLGQKAILWLGMFLVLLATAAWVYGQFIQRVVKYRGLAYGIFLALLLLDYFWILEGKLHWRNPELASISGNGEIANDPSGIQWQKWSAEAVEQARAAGHPVLIDFTAVWCLTCQLNKESSIEIDSVRKKLKEMNAVPLLADFTAKSPVIAKELKRLNRAGVPLVVVYPADPNAPPILLPEILTPSVVLNALELASSKSSSQKPVSRGLSSN